MDKPQLPSLEGRRCPTGLRAAARDVTGYWWLWLVAGIAWIVISLVILQFDQASITTVGVLVGLHVRVRRRPERSRSRRVSEGAMRWVVGDLRRCCSSISAVVCFISPEEHVRRRWRTCSASCSCSSASGGWSGRSWSGR